MSTLKNKIDFELLVSVTNANPNGDPLGGNRPRTDYDGYGEISDVCIKRKIRNRMQDMGNAVFVQSDDNHAIGDTYKTLKERAEATIGNIKVVKKEKNAEDSSILTKEDYIKTACEKYLDVRSFGQVFAFGKSDDNNPENGGETDNKKEEKGVSANVRGPVSIQLAKSVDAVDIQSMQITKSVSGDKKEGQERGKDTMGTKSFVSFGLYVIKGSVNVQLAEKTGFSEEDAEILKECLRTLFVNDTSSARPDGSMEVVKLYWWQHNCKDGQYSSAKVHRLVSIAKKDGVTEPTSVDDYNITLSSLDGLRCDSVDGI